MSRIKTERGLCSVNGAGFTLIELLTVMAIIIAMGAVTLVSYFAIVRGSAMKSATGQLRSTLLLARQLAVMESRRQYVIFGQGSTDTNEMWYVLVSERGTLTYVVGDKIGEKYGDLSDLLPGSELYNLSREALPSTFVTNAAPGEIIPKWAVKDDPQIFLRPGDRYGYAVSSINMLPRGFAFGQGTPSLPSFKAVVFGADGTLRDTRGNPATQDQEIFLYEAINSARIITVKIDAPAGLIDIIFP